MTEYRQIKPFKIVGISTNTTNKNGQSMEDLGVLWEQFYAENIPSKIPAKLTDDIYTIYTDYQSDYRDTYTAIIGYKVSTLVDIPEGLTGRAFSGGNYLKYTAKGKIPDAVANTWKKIWQQEEDLDRVYTTDFEVYGKQALNTDQPRVNIYIATR